MSICFARDATACSDVSAARVTIAMNLVDEKMESKHSNRNVLVKLGWQRVREAIVQVR